jgi:hypothetical protein
MEKAWQKRCAACRIGLDSSKRISDNQVVILVVPVLSFLDLAASSVKR